MCACGVRACAWAFGSAGIFLSSRQPPGFPSAHTHERDFREFLCDSVLYEEEEGSFTCLAA
jgi:hypothetical protein